MGQQRIQLHFHDAEKRVSGSSGCNRFNGSYEQAGDALSFGQMMSTMMACADGMALEQEIFGSLGRVAHFSMREDELVLMDENRDGGPLLRYRSE